MCVRLYYITRLHQQGNVARRAYCEERLQEIRTGPDSDKKSKTSHSDPILVTLDGVTNGKTLFLVTKIGPRHAISYFS